MRALLTLAAIVICSVAVFAAPAPKNLPRLTKTVAFPSAYRDAARAVARHIASPSDYFAQVEPQNDGGELVFHLWHKTAFLPQNRGGVGNPGGKCLDVVYDTKKHKVVHDWAWQ